MVGFAVVVFAVVEFAVVGFAVVGFAVVKFTTEQGEHVPWTGARNLQGMTRKQCLGICEPFVDSQDGLWTVINQLWMRRAVGQERGQRCLDDGPSSSK